MKRYRLIAKRVLPDTVFFGTILGLIGWQLSTSTPVQLEFMSLVAQFFALALLVIVAVLAPCFVVLWFIIDTASSRLEREL